MQTEDWKTPIEAVMEKVKEYEKQNIQDQLDRIDIKKIRYLVESEKGDESGRKYFDEYEVETVKLRDELKVLEDANVR